MLCVPPERVFDLGLFKHGIDTPQPVRLRIGHIAEMVERIVEIIQRVAIGPSALRLFRGQDRVIDRLFGIVAAAEVKRQ